MMMIIAMNGMPNPKRNGLVNAQIGDGCIAKLEKKSTGRLPAMPKRKVDTSRMATLSGLPILRVFSRANTTAAMATIAMNLGWSRKSTRVMR